MSDGLRQAVKDAVGEVLDEKLGAFFIEREQHYQDHCFIKGVRNGVDTVKKGSLWSFGIGIIGFIIYAITAWIRGVK